MNTLVPSLLNITTAAVCFGLAAMVLVRNPGRPTHKTFAALSSLLALWALGVLGVIRSHNEVEIRPWLHLAEVVVCFVPGVLYHFVGYFPRGQFDGNRKLLGFYYAAGAILALNSFMPWYFGEISFPPGRPPTVQHHDSILAVFALQLLAILTGHANLRSKQARAQGFGRRQIQFVTTGMYLVGVLTVTTASLDPLFGIPTFQAYGPVAIMLLMGFFSYAMVRYHLLDTRAMLSRAIVYTGGAGFVFAVYLLFVFIVARIADRPVGAADIVPGLFAAMTITICYPKTREWVAHLIEVRLLGQRYDIDNLYTRLAQQSAEIVDLDTFLETVARDIQDTIGVRTIRVLLLDPDDPSILATEITTVPNEPPMRTREHQVLIDFLTEYPQPLILEQILHGRPDERLVSVASSLADLEAFFCLPLKTGAGLVGIMTLGAKDTHDVYSEQELVAFRALQGPLGTAIANARLYRELARVHLHQSNVFRQMREGVIAVDINGRVTMTNRAAQNMLGTIADGRHIDELPSEVAELLRTTLRRELPVSDYETQVVGPEGEPIPLIVSGSCLRNESGKTSGAVALLYDLSLVKRLERNVQRADRLSSIGTLAAGMAHEIKNPLVSIKTFTQLLADRYKDPEFMKTFEEVVPHEVDRIDGIVSRLLDFARPRPVRYTGVDLRRTVEEVLALVENQLRKNFIDVDVDFPNESFRVRGDEQQLHQVFLNLILNAIDAMKQQGEGQLKIRARSSYLFQRKQDVSSLVERKCLRVTLSDTGCGIPAEKLAQLFTPFFTTKDDGCGLGLAVVHGIVDEHGGEIDVASEEGHGTTFTVSLPLVTAEELEEAHAQPTVT